MIPSPSLVERLRKRAEIRRSIPRAPLGTSDKISDLLEEAANEIERLLFEKQWSGNNVQ